MMKKPDILHNKLNEFFYKKKTVESLIEFIYKNVYELIDEIPYVTEELWWDLKTNYRSYYYMVIEKSGEEWLETLFPNPDLSYYCSFKEMYIGIVGRLWAFSNRDLPKYYSHALDN